jgi:hypothetical protein
MKTLGVSKGEKGKRWLTPREGEKKANALLRGKGGKGKV